VSKNQTHENTSNHSFIRTASGQYDGTEKSAAISQQLSNFEYIPADRNCVSLECIMHGCSYGQSPIARRVEGRGLMPARIHTNRGQPDPVCMDTIVTRFSYPMISVENPECPFESNLYSVTTNVS
jgi:hypothetical protein